MGAQNSFAEILYVFYLRLRESESDGGDCLRRSGSDCARLNRRLKNFQYSAGRAKTWPKFSTSTGNHFWELSGIC